MRYTLVLNSDYLPLEIQDSKRAFLNVYKDTVDSIDIYPDAKFRSTLDEWDVPSVVRTRTFVRRPYQKASLTKANVHKRDGYTCVYCGEDARKHLTVDHVIPRSRGGKNSWDNLVTCCFACNNVKDNRTPEEMGWETPNPQHPHHIVLMNKLVKDIPEQWRPFLFM